MLDAFFLFVNKVYAEGDPITNPRNVAEWAIHIRTDAVTAVGGAELWAAVIQDAASCILRKSLLALIKLVISLLFCSLP